jgi:hypothetical protein
LISVHWLYKIGKEPFHSSLIFAFKYASGQLVELPLTGNFQHRRKTVGRDKVRKDKNGGNKQNEDWKEICKDCEILKKGNNCYYGCEIIKAALRKEKKERI